MRPFVLLALAFPALPVAAQAALPWPSIGRAAAWADPVSIAERYAETPLLLTGVLSLCLAATFLGLWRAARDFSAFRSLGLFYGLVTLQQFALYVGEPTLTLSLRAIACGALVETASDAMRVERRWTRLFWPLYLFVAVALWFPHYRHFYDWPVYASDAVLLILAIIGMRRGNPRDRAIANAFLVYVPIRLTLTSLGQLLIHTGENFSLAGWQWSYTALSLSVLGFVTLAIFVRDLIRDRAEKQRLAAELAASRAVQQLLNPEELPLIPGFALQSVYRPYGEVGGDFSQILPLPEGGAIVAIGDVSGKGMPAAMLVSLIVGALQALARQSRSPAQLLAGLNQSVLQRSHGGFTTCLIVHLELGGLLRFANAGHIPPYLDGHELAIEGSLPLGLSPDSIYVESSALLAPGSQVTLITDGVLEARKTSGELLGFERAAALSVRRPEEIAQAAQDWGQEDDITVLAVRLAHPTAP